MTTNPDRVSLARHRAAIERIRKIDELMAPLADERKALEASLKAAMGEATTGTIGKTVVARWEIGTRSSLDQKAFKAEMPDIHRKYLKTIPVRSFKLVDPE